MTTNRRQPVLSAVKFLHERWVFGRRARVLSTLLAEICPVRSAILDVGCGNGTIGFLINQIKPDISIQGLEVMARRSCLIKCIPFDGANIPLPESSADVCMFVDVLHHTLNIEGLLREAGRVARRYIIIKDHLCESWLDKAALKFMDWAGNRAHGVSLPYNYQSKAEWYRLFCSSSLRIVQWNQKIPLYPRPFSPLFGRSLHFIALLEKAP
ncbi:MAG: class I SAM-dependent methyltransferase [Terriglobia bacterium]